MNIIGIDHGYAAIKTSHFVFSSGIVEYEHEPYTNKNVLEYDGKYYVCGTGRQPLVQDKTSNHNYYLLTLAALAKEIEKRNISSSCTVTLAVGLPLTTYGRDKKKFKSYLMKEETVSFKYEGKSYEITIEDVGVFPQAFSAITQHGYLLAGEPSAILADIGGWTVDIMRLDKGIPDAGTCRSLELGMIRCIDEVSEQVRRSTGKSLSAVQIETILSGSVCRTDASTKAIVETEGKKYTQRLLSAIAEAGFDISAMPIIFIGGGARLMDRHVGAREGVCRAITLTDERVNAKGFEALCRQISGRS